MSLSFRYCMAFLNIHLFFFFFKPKLFLFHLTNIMSLWEERYIVFSFSSAEVSTFWQKKLYVLWLRIESLIYIFFIAEIYFLFINYISKYRHSLKFIFEIPLDITWWTPACQVEFSMPEFWSDDIFKVLIDIFCVFQSL